MDWLRDRGQALLESFSNGVWHAQTRVVRINPKMILQATLFQESLLPGPPTAASISCPNAQLSCHNTSVVDTCCLNHPGGLMLQTQFWDTDPPTGPSDSWTVHGLWPDLCDGTYEANCDKSRVYTNISAILTAGGGAGVLSDMQQYWKDYHGDDQNLWSHEWSKHGTCVSTLDTKCYTDYRPQEEVVDYFKTTMALFHTLPTYQTLASVGVTPSSSRTWTAEEIQAPLRKMHGGRVTLGCRGKLLNEVWYHLAVRGSVQTGQFIAAEGVGAKSRCPGTGIRYLAKDSGRSTSRTAMPTQTQTEPSPTSSAAPFSGRGYLTVYVKGDRGESRRRGCLISGGSWYVSGTCAGFRVQDDVIDQSSPPGTDEDEAPMFTLMSSNGPCGIMDDKFQCAKKLPAQTIFSTASNGRLSYQKRTLFYAASEPMGFQKADISTVRGPGEEGVEVEIGWSARSPEAL